MGMLMHHTWLEQQKQNEKPKKAEPAPAEKPEKESAPVKKTGGRPKKK